MLELPAGGRRGSISLQLPGLQAYTEGNAKGEVIGNTKDNSWKGILFRFYHPSSVLLSSAPRQDIVVGLIEPELSKHEQQETFRSVWPPNVNSFPLDNMFSVVTNTKYDDRAQGCCVRGSKNNSHYKNCLKKLAASKLAHSCGPDSRDTCKTKKEREREEDLYSPNCHIYRIYCYPNAKGGTAIAVRKGNPMSLIGGF
jgi:hypothetical protein